MKSWLSGKAEAGRDRSSKARAIGRQAASVHYNTTTAPGRGEHSPMGCVVTMAEAEREKRPSAMGPRSERVVWAR